MSKVRHYLIDKEEKYRIIGDFFEIVANLKSKKEIINFFLGLFTPSEAVMIARRIQIAKMIMEDKSYQEIKKALNTGYDTISKTHNWLSKRKEEYEKWIKECLSKSESKFPIFF